MELTNDVLNHLRVLEMGQGVAVATAGMLLAELGADVTKVDSRADTPVSPSSPNLELVLNRNKKIIRLDADEAERMLCEADSAFDVILIGLGWEEVVKTNKLRESYHESVWVHIDDGLALGCLHPADDLLAVAYSGLAYRQQGHREGPYCLTEPVAAFGTGLVVAAGALAGLLERERSGRASYIETSYLDGAIAVQCLSACFLLDTPLADHRLVYADPYSVAGRPTLRYYKAEDGWVLVGAVTGPQWGRLCIMLGRPELVSDPRFESAPASVPDKKAAELLVGLISEFVSSKTVESCIDLCREYGIVTAPVLSHDQFLDHPQCRANDLMNSAQDSAGQDRVVVGNFLKITQHRPGSLPHSKSGRPSSYHQESPLPLAGLKVVDSASLIAAPMCAKILGDLGAEVIKVEPPEGDPFRNDGLGFSATNRRKRSLGLNLKIDEGRAAFYRLIRQSDVLISNARAGAEGKIGLEDTALSEANPNLITVRVSGFGTQGPLAGERGLDASAQAMCGAVLAIGNGSEAMGYRDGILDNTTGWLCTIGVLASLYKKTRSGSGGYVVETNLLNAAAMFQSRRLVRPMLSQEPILDPNRLGYSPYQRLYATSDGWLCLAAITAGDCQKVNSLMSSQGMNIPVCSVKEPADGPTGAAFEQVFRHSKMEYWTDQFDQIGFKRWVRLSTIEELARSSDDLFTPIHQEPWGQVLQYKRFLRFYPGADLIPSLTGAPYLPGIDNEEILRDFGFQREEMEQLIHAGAILASPFKLAFDNDVS